MRFFVITLTARGLQIPLQDEETEHEEVKSKVHCQDRKQHHPVGLRLTGQDAVQDQVDQTIGEGGADADLKRVADCKCQARETYMDREQHRSQEQERELDRLGDAGQEGSQGDGEQQGSDDLLLFRTGTGIHGQSCAGKSAHHEGVLTGQETAGVHGELHGVRRSELREEDVLSAHDGIAVDDSRAADTSLPEGHVEDMVQTEGDQGTLDAAVDEGSEQTRSLDDAAQSEDHVLDDGPHDIEDSAGHNTEDHADDRDETCAREEGQRIRKLGLIELIAELRGAETGDDTAEHTHLQRLDAKHGSDGALFHVRSHCAVHDGSVNGKKRVDGGQHDQVEDRGTKDRDTLFLLGHAQGDRQREHKRQVSEDRVSCGVQHHEEVVDQCPFMQDAGQTVGRNCRRVCERTSDTEQNTGERKDCDGQEQRFTDLLGSRKYRTSAFSLCHNRSPFSLNARCSAQT